MVAIVMVIAHVFFQHVEYPHLGLTQRLLLLFCYTLPYALALFDFDSIWATRMGYLWQLVAIGMIASMVEGTGSSHYWALASVPLFNLAHMIYKRSKAA